MGDVQKRFTHIVNHLKGLGKVFGEDKLNVKILKSLNRTWQSKVMIISDSKDLSSITHVELLKKLREYEIDTTWMTEEVAKENKSRGLVVKSSIRSSDESDEENGKGSKSENLTLIVRKFIKFLNKKNPKGRSFQHKRNYNKNKSTSSNFTCFECGKLGHIKSECSIF